MIDQTDLTLPLEYILMRFVRPEEMNAHMITLQSKKAHYHGECQETIMKWGKTLTTLKRKRIEETFAAFSSFCEEAIEYCEELLDSDIEPLPTPFPCEFSSMRGNIKLNADIWVCVLLSYVPNSSLLHLAAVCRQMRCFIMEQTNFAYKWGVGTLIMKTRQRSGMQETVLIELERDGPSVLDRLEERKRAPIQQEEERWPQRLTSLRGVRR
eukprot:TRINITY_DN67967_c2_g1_i1.p1 TRINITY_DN67967_c2_g1~~TRINITY_DN67967_c2_g1_i1.p1  ORF type:complete len:233 (+),score=5.53 TRINITY_DN67967_c2_g1_i1:67-699(+)